MSAAGKELACIQRELSLYFLMKLTMNDDLRKRLMTNVKKPEESIHSSEPMYTNQPQLWTANIANRLTDEEWSECFIPYLKFVETKAIEKCIAAVQKKKGIRLNSPPHAHYALNQAIQALKELLPNR